MDLANENNQSCIAADGADLKSCYMQKFRLYETRSKFYMIGRDKNRTFWRVLKIDRLEPSELNISEDSTVYSEIECCDLLRRIHEGNKSTGGLKFVTTCYGIIGFIKFLEPHYMLLITKRRKIGTICGHTIYAIAKTEVIPVPHSTVRSKMAYSNDENRYKKLLCCVDLTKDFFFSYSYHVMHSLQKNLSDNNTSGQLLYETMFVWNEFLTRGIRNNLQSTSWTIALVYGFFKQVKLSIAGREFNLTVIARRSRHYAGTRYLKRGVNEKGRVANDVETEQIVFQDSHNGCPMQISSVVQNRGSIPLFWSQDSSRLNIKPDIILSKKDYNYEATRLHFDNLVTRYGNPIIILNLIKTQEKKPRETILLDEFAHAVNSINKTLKGQDRLRFIGWDLHLHSRISKATNVLTQLGRVASYALNLTGIFYGQVTPIQSPEQLLKYSSEDNNIIDHSVPEEASFTEDTVNSKIEVDHPYCSLELYRGYRVKPQMFQSGVLRTNCIDCLDRTNVAQYAFGLKAIGRQLQALGFLESSDIDFDNDLAKEMMAVYESMGDTLARQYGGSAAHNKIFSEKRGQWKAATQSQEFLRTLQRYYNNTYLDANKQKAINIFLGHFQPQQDKPALWELDSDQHYHVGRHGPCLVDENVRSTFKRSLSAGNIPCRSAATYRPTQVSGKLVNHCLSGSVPDIFTCGSDLCYCRQIYRLVIDEKCDEGIHVYFDEHGDARYCSDDFLDLDWVSSGNSCEEELLERATTISSENIVNELRTEATTSASELGASMMEMKQSGGELDKDAKYTEIFVNWVNNGHILSV